MIDFCAGKISQNYQLLFKEKIYWYENGHQFTYTILSCKKKM